MDNSSYYNRPNYYYSKNSEDRGEPSTRNRVLGNKSYRDFSPVRPRDRSPIQEKTDRHSPDRQRKRLSKSHDDEPARLHGRVQFRASHHDESSLIKIRPPIKRSAPVMNRPSPADIRRQVFDEELKEYNEIFSFSHNFDEKVYEGYIEHVKNFEIAKKYFEDSKDLNLKPTKKMYLELMKKAVIENRQEEAEEIVQEAALGLGIDVHTELIKLLMEENKPQQAVNMLKHAGGLSKLPILLTAAEQSKNRLPDFILEHLMQLCRHKGDQPANLPAAYSLYMYTYLNQIRATKDFYIKLADVYYERGELQQAQAIFNTFIGFEIKTENHMEKVDLHGLTPRVGMILIRAYLDMKRDNSPFIVVTGQGHNSLEGVQFIMRDFIIANFPHITKNWIPYVPANNPGMLIVQLKPS